MKNGGEVILSSDIVEALPVPLGVAVPQIAHVERERKLGRDIADFIGIPYREVKGGEVWFGLDQPDKDVTERWLGVSKGNEAEPKKDL
jgi:hypothetical protein